MKNWESLYSVLKATREEKDNIVLTNMSYRKLIVGSISKRDIEKMSKKELQDAVISYLEAIVPEFR